jgi:SH3-like domain-containing protein
VDVVGMFPRGETWNTFRTPIRVCLRGGGDVQFLDAVDSTRTIRTLSPTVDAPEGYVCANVTGAGTVLLTPSGPALGVSAAVQTSATTITTNVASADANAVTPLNNCEVITAVNGVYLRREPNTSARIRWTFEDGQVLTATGIAGNWYRIDFRGQPGWIAAAFVTPSGNCLSPGGSAVGASNAFAPGDSATYFGLTDCQITTNVNGVNLRREPSLTASIRWTFEDSQTLDAVGVSGNWFLIAFRGEPGWINAQFVDAVGDCAQGAS